MSGWESEAIRWFGLAEQQVAGLLRLIGQDNELLTLGTMTLIALMILAVVWALVLELLGTLLALFGAGGEREPEGSAPDLRERGFAFGPALSRDEPGRLDVVPSAGEKGPRLKARPAEEPRANAPAPRARSAARLREAAGGSPGALAVSPADDFRQVQLRQLPQLTDRGHVVSARPEWTGKVVPGSLQEAGAVEVCRVLTRRPSALAGSQSVRAVDYRVCGLPRVDDEGRRQPDLLVYAVADRGFLPKTGPAKPGRR
jgi:hypothetical protein